MANEKKEIEGWRERKEKQKEIQKGNLTNITSIAVSKVGQCDGVQALTSFCSYYLLVRRKMSTQFWVQKEKIELKNQRIIWIVRINKEGLVRS